MDRAIMSQFVCEKQMARIRAVLTSKSVSRLTADQESQFEWLSATLNRFGLGKKESLVASVMSHTGNYWRSGILLVLSSGPYRPVTISRLFSAINPLHPISRRILNMNLKELERDGLIVREVMEDEWNHVEYSLTDLGRGLAKHILAITEWIAEHGDEIITARANFRDLKDDH